MPILAKVVLLGLVNALALWALPLLLGDRQYILLAGLVLGTIVTDYVFLAPKAYPMRFILPGFAFLAAMVVYPIGYTVYVSFTNFSTGHILSKQMVIDQYQSRFILQEDLPAYKAEFFQDKAGSFAVLLTARDGTVLVGAGKDARPLGESNLRPADPDGDGIYDSLGGYRRVSGLQIFSLLGRLQKPAHMCS